MKSFFIKFKAKHQIKTKAIRKQLIEAIKQNNVQELKNLMQEITHDELAEWKYYEAPLSYALKLNKFFLIDCIIRYTFLNPSNKYYWFVKKNFLCPIVELSLLYGFRWICILYESISFHFFGKLVIDIYQALLNEKEGEKIFGSRFNLFHTQRNKIMKIIVLSIYLGDGKHQIARITLLRDFYFKWYCEYVFSCHKFKLLNNEQDAKSNSKSDTASNIIRESKSNTISKSKSNIRRESKSDTISKSKSDIISESMDEYTMDPSTEHIMHATKDILIQDLLFCIRGSDIFNIYLLAKNTSNQKIITKLFSYNWYHHHNQSDLIIFANLHLYSSSTNLEKHLLLMNKSIGLTYLKIILHYHLLTNSNLTVDHPIFFHCASYSMMDVDKIYFYPHLKKVVSNMNRFYEEITRDDSKQIIDLTSLRSIYSIERTWRRIQTTNIHLFSTKIFIMIKLFSRAKNIHQVIHKLKKFFEICQSLPKDLQIIVSNRAVGLHVNTLNPYNLQLMFQYIKHICQTK
jgi:hypothetical protein